MTVTTDAGSIRAAQSDDADAVAGIYNHYILHSPATFETRALVPAEMAQRITQVCNAQLPWLLLECDGQVTGYAYAAPWKIRHGYRYSVETSIYLAPNHLGHGWGTRLYAALLTALHGRGLHTAIGGVTLPNPASVALHEKAGFRKVAHFCEVGFKFEQWLDVGYWQRPLS